MSLKEQLAEYRAGWYQRVPAERQAIMRRHIDELRSGAIARTMLKVGDRAPAIVLENAKGATVDVGALLAKGPVIVTFYRGGWCPYCNLALHQYQAELVPQLSRFNARMAAISPQTPDQSLSTAEKHALQFSVLSDAGARVARRLGVAFEPADDVLEAQRALGLDIREGNAEGAAELPMPTVLVVDSDRVVRFADVHPDYTSRTEVQAIISALADL